MIVVKIVAINSKVRTKFTTLEQVANTQRVQKARCTTMWARRQKSDITHDRRKIDWQTREAKL